MFEGLLKDGNSYLMYGAAALGSVASLVCMYHCNLHFSRANEPSVMWSWVPILGHALDFGKKPIELMLEKSRETKSDVVGLVLAGERVFFLKDPRSFNVIVRSDKKKLSFDVFTNKVMYNVFGISKALNEDDMNDVSEKAHPLYNKHIYQDEGCSELTRRMQTKMIKLSKEIPSAARNVDMMDFIYRFVYQASVAALFNESLSDDDAVYKYFLEFDEKFAATLAGVPFSMFPSALKSRELCVERVDKEKHRACPLISERVDLIMNKCAVNSTDDSRFELAVMWASSGNTMPAAYWVLYFLLADERAKKAVLNELSEIYGSRIPSPDLCISAGDLPKMVILDSCISEALRLMSGSMIMREVISDDCELAFSSGVTYSFRKGDKVGIFPPLVHYDEKIFADPEIFRHDRFVNAPSEYVFDGQRIPASQCFLPFGAGQHWCPGRKFARNEIKTIVAFLLSNFHLAFTDPEHAKVYGREYDGSRAGLGVFPPKAAVSLTVSAKWN